jgi:tetratricopeptide (TPR) repeat protein
VKIWLAVALLVSVLGCGGGAPMPPQAFPPEPAPVRNGTPDQVLLEEAVRGRNLSPVEVAGLSDRLLGEGNPACQDQQTMARLEILLLKSLKGDDKASRPALLRNLGIIHYCQSKYKSARQELQASNELNPRDARTHFYLARIFARQGEIYQSKGKKRISRQQFKRADIEMEQARKLDPKNPLYRQDLKQVLQQEQGK